MFCQGMLLHMSSAKCQPFCSCLDTFCCFKPELSEGLISNLMCSKTKIYQNKTTAIFGKILPIDFHPSGPLMVVIMFVVLEPMPANGLDAAAV